MYYFDVYFPKVAKGMNIRVGRYISLPDIEAQLAPNNYTYSHSMLYTVDPYTQTGIIASIKLSDHWMVQAGLSGGNDIAPWTTDAKLTGNVCVDYTWHKGGDALYTCANSSTMASTPTTTYRATTRPGITDQRQLAHRHRELVHVKDTPNMYWYNSGGKSRTPGPYPVTIAA